MENKFKMVNRKYRELPLVVIHVDLKLLAIFHLWYSQVLKRMLNSN